MLLVQVLLCFCQSTKNMLSVWIMNTWEMFASYLWTFNAHVLKWTTFVFSLTCVCSQCTSLNMDRRHVFIHTCVLAMRMCCILVLYHVCVSLTCVVAVYMCVHVCCRFASTVALIQRRFVFCRLRHLCYWAAMSTLAHLVNLLLHKNLHNCFLNKRKLVHVFGFEPIFLATCFWFFLLFFDFLWCLGISVFQGLTIKVYFHFLPWLLPYGCRVYV